MGNRATVTFQDRGTEVGSIYLHWNGGRESVQAFLDYALAVGVRTNDPTYALARVTQIIGNFFGGTTSIGTGDSKFLDTDGDNGQYFVDANTLTISSHVAGSLYSPPEDTPFDTDYYEKVLEEVRAKNDPIFVPTN